MFEDLSHTAKWKVVTAHTVSYRQVHDQSLPCVELVDTNGPTVSHAKKYKQWDVTLINFIQSNRNVIYILKVE